MPKALTVIFSSDAERNLDGVQYRLGDMVWAKVKSHPWWPGQLYDPALASPSAMEVKRDSCFLVAFFGDGTFGWFAEAELIPYEPNFAQKSKQTSAPNFVAAVEDSLDEIGRRVKLGLTCHCSSSEQASKIGDERAGLLYDRQLHDIRRNFEPEKLFSAIKQLACSPFSFSQNMLRTTVAGGQTVSFRCLVLCKKLPEHKEFEDVGEINHIKVQPDVIISAKVSKDKILREKNAIKKHQLKMSLLSKSCLEQQDGIKGNGFKEKLGGIDGSGKCKQHTRGVNIKNGNTEKRKDFSGDKGVIRSTVLVKGSVQPVEYSVQVKQTMSASVSKEIQKRKAPSKARGIQESLQTPEQSKTYMTSISSNRSIPGLVGRDSLTTNTSKAQQRNLIKSCVKTISEVVPEMEGMELVLTVKEPNAALKKAKVEKVQVFKLKATNKFGVADVERSQARKSVKVVSGVKDKVFKQPKRPLEDEDEDVLSGEIKKRKLLPESRDEDNSDDSLCDHTGNSIASDSLPTSELSQRADKVINGSMDLESNLKYPQIESFLGERGSILPAETPEMMLSQAGQVNQDGAQRHKHVDNDANEAPDTEALFVMQRNELNADYKSVDSFQADITSSISKKNKEKVKDPNVLEYSEVSTCQAETVLDMSKKEQASQETNIVDLLKPDGLSNHYRGPKGQWEGEKVETSSNAIKDQALKDLNVSSSEADPSLAHFYGISAVRSCSCSAVQNMQDASQTKKEESSVKYDQERKLAVNMVSNQLPPSNKISSSKRRAMEECISKGLNTNKKRIKTFSLEGAAECHPDFQGEEGEGHEGLNRQDKEDTHPQNLLEGLMSIAAKPLDAAMINFREVVYKQGVYHANLEPSLAVGVSEGVIGVVNENDKMTELVTEQAISSDKPIVAEPSKVEDGRIYEGCNGLASKKQSEKDTTTTPLNLTKRSATISKSPSSGSISLRPAFEPKIPVHSSKDVLDRFGQRVPRLLDAAEKITSLSSRGKSYSEERALVISFPHGGVLPSEKQLIEVFAKFGDLNTPLTTVDPKSAYAHIVFRHTQDAEVALRSMKEKPFFENARFWLKPIDVNRKEMAKLGSRNMPFSNRPTLASGQFSEAKIVSDKVRSKSASDRGLLVCPNNVGPVGVVDLIEVAQNISSRMAQGDGIDSALQFNYGVKNTPPSFMNAKALQKAPVGALGPGQGKLDGIHNCVVASSSVVLEAGPMSLASSNAADIAEPFLALLHQLHDLVVSTGFVL